MINMENDNVTNEENLLACLFEEMPVAQLKDEKTEEKTEEKETKISVPYDILADYIMKHYKIMTFDDTKEMLLYENGVYKLEGAETTINLAIRNGYVTMCNEYAEKKGKKISYVHKPLSNYVAEVIKYIKLKTAVLRSCIDSLYPHLINLQNGMFDIQQWKLLPHSPAYKSIRQIPVTYDIMAECPHIKKFLNDVVSTEDAKVLLEFTGYAMIPDTRIQKAFMLYGEGSNGKSIFLNLLTKFIGEKNTSGVSLQKLETDKFAVANLYGKLLNVYPDLKDQSIYHSDIFKTLVGCDRIHGEKKYCDAFEFRNKARLIFSANKIPAVKNDDFAYFRRWILIHFPNLFEEGKNDDKDLIAKITTEKELSGFLNLALHALKRLLEAQKYSYTKSIEEVTKVYKENSSNVALFAEKCLIVSTDSAEKTEIYEAYEEWAKENGIKVEKFIEFGRQFKKLGYTDDRPYDNITGKRIPVWENVAVDKQKLESETSPFKEPINKSAFIPKAEPVKSFSDIHIPQISKAVDINKLW